MEIIQQIINKLKEKKDLNKEDLLHIVQYFEGNNINDKDIENLVIGWREKQETSEEIKSLAEIINNNQNQKSISIDAIDMCGTGGDKLNTINISTLAAVVVSSCGLPVIKHSGRSSTGLSGSVDVLSDLGLNIDITYDEAEKCFKNTNLMFVSSTYLRSLFSRVKEAGKRLGIPTFVNLLGPLTNPYKTTFHLLGVSRFEWGKLLSVALKSSINKSSLIVSSEVSQNTFMDELSFCGKNYIWKITNGKDSFEEATFDGELVNCQELVVKSKEENKRHFQEILSGKLSKSNPKLQIVALNSGAAFYLAGRSQSIWDGYECALEHIQTGKAWEHFLKFLNSSKKR